jgi:Cys-rich protein (TIGR01571 family)
MDLRTKFRQQYAIEGSIAGDFCVGTFCPLCVAVQIANEARDYGHRIFS